MLDAVRAVQSLFPLVAPEVMLLAGACVFFLVAAFAAPPDVEGSERRERQSAWAVGAVAALLLAAALWAPQLNLRAEAPAANMLRFDVLAWYAKGLSLGAGLLVALLSWRRVGPSLGGEYYGCLLLAVAGLNFVGMANDLVGLFLALELVSIPTYILLYLGKHDERGHEAALKYFLLSVFSSAIFIYGLTFLYGVCGSTNLEVVRASMLGGEAVHLRTLLILSMVLVVAGLSFRITAVPFHFYALDVFAGTSLPMAAFLSLAPKIAGFVALFRLVAGVMLVPTTDVPIYGQVEGPPSAELATMMGVLAVATMFAGNMIALVQTEVRRLMAYSGVAHGGYMLLALSVGQPDELAVPAIQAVLFYLTAYGAMTIGAFAVLTAASDRDAPIENIDDLRGLARRRPALAAAMALFLFSLIGLPPTAGMMGKLQILLALWSKNSATFWFLAVLLAVNVAIGAVYYIRLLLAVYSTHADHRPAVRTDAPSLVVVAICAAITLGLFVFPNVVLKVLQHLY
jgi:NADH-quinone oxidoreductase subunit N